MQKSIFRGAALITCLLTLLAAAAVFCYFLYFGGAGTVGTAVYFTLTGLALLFAGLLLSFFISARLAAPLRRGGEELMGKYEELAPLMRRIELQRSEIRLSASELEEKSLNLQMIMEFMQEGLILLDSRALILSINRAALEMLEMPDLDYRGRHLFAANRSPALETAVQAALTGKSAEEVLRRGDRTLQIIVNPIFVEGVVRGIVLLVLDATDRQAAEQMRREFSANVSHELKTPLTSITGFAELIESGMVRPEDITRFAGRIHSEARHLIALIDDIIKLSRLDEKSSELHRERVSLLAIARDISARLQERAEEHGISLAVRGEDVSVNGNAQILEEMILNLCDNALKYNRPGGEAEILVETRDGVPVLTVRDTGIGIPREDQSRIFERFYRVDKSHSKDTGGTGLGLSIVKHGALFHGAVITVDSKPNAGTAITLKFENND